MHTKTPARVVRRLLVAAILGLVAEITMPQLPAQPAAQPGGQPAVQHAAPTVRPFGRLPDGREALLYTLEAGSWRATVTDFGAILTSFRFPPAAGAAAGSGVDVALGFDDLAGYVAKHPYFGATCGRIAGRIKGAAFDLDGKTYPLAKNLADTHLHGGVEGFDKKLWRGTPRATDRGPAVELELVSPDGEEGYPGRLTARVVYTLTPAGELWVEMTATTAAPTIVNLAHHSYWNLAGHGSGSIANHELAIVADRYLPLDAESVPTGGFLPVADTPFDFRPERRPRARCGPAIDALPRGPAADAPRGVDHCYVVRDWQPDGKLQSVATFRDPESGRTLEVLADQPAVQVYMGIYLDGSLTGKDGAVYRANGGLCLETQKYPDSVHHPDWPSWRLDPGQVYRSAMIHRFSVSR